MLYKSLFKNLVFNALKKKYTIYLKHPSKQQCAIVKIYAINPELAAHVAMKMVTQTYNMHLVPELIYQGWLINLVPFQSSHTYKLSVIPKDSRPIALRPI